MKKIKINFSDFYNGFDKENNDFTRLLRERYEVEISECPDYLFFSVFGTEHMNFDCIKIFYTGECVTPDFNLCDYAIGFDYLSFEDRYIRVPLYELFQYRQKYIALLEGTTNETKKTDFCSFVCSNDQGMKQRFEMFQLLNRYKKIQSGGKCLNNVGGAVKDKFEFDSKHKFSIAFENCSYPGYTTEKIVEAFAAGTIPIYYGNPRITEEFNAEAFINCHEYNSFEEVVERVKEIDCNDELYASIKEKTIISGAKKTQNDMRNFLYSIVGQPLEHARRRPVNTRIYEKEEQIRVYRKYNQFIGKKIRLLKALLRRIKNNSV